MGYSCLLLGRDRYAASYSYDHYRQHMGKTGLGNLVDMGPAVDDHIYSLGSLRCLSGSALRRRRAGKKARYSAIFAIIAFVDLPVVYVSARIKRGISPVVFGPGGGGIDPAMMHTLLVVLLGFTLLFLLLLGERIRIMNMENALYARAGRGG